MVRQDNDASGQVGPETKFKQDDEKPRLSGRRRADRTGTKLEKAKERLAARKPRRPPGLAKKAVRQVRAGTWQYLHGKIHQVEQENAGVESAHKSELVAEGGLRRLSRHVKKRWSSRPVRLVEKWERRHIRANAGWQFRQLTQEHPALKSNVFSRAIQKRKMKRQYAQKARQAAKQGAKAAGRTASYTEKAVRAVGSAIMRHPVGVLIAGASVLVVYLLCSVLSLFPLMGGGLTGAVDTAATYTAADADILGAEADYADWEEALRRGIAGIAKAHVGYDEYRYDVGVIGHDPYELAAYLSVKYGAYTRAGIQRELAALFNEQYTLTLSETKEKRHTANGRAYMWNVLHITLRSRSLSDLADSRLNAEQKEIYEVMLEYQGNRPGLWHERSAYEQSN